MFKRMSIAVLGVLIVSGVFLAEEPLAQPYLQNVTHSSIVVRWITAEASIGVVKYGPGSKCKYTATEDAKRKLHEVTLTGLEPGTTYKYQVEIGGRKFTGQFKTALKEDQPYTFVIWGDNRTFPKTHQSVADQMVKHKPDLAISVGDIVTNSKTMEIYYREFFGPAQELFRNVPFFVAVGNHEYMGDRTIEKFKKVLTQPGNERYFAFSYGNARFILLDSNDKTITKGVQLDWLKQELNSEAYQKAEFRFLFLHHAPYCWDWYGGQKEIEKALVPLAEKHKIDIFFGGHFHCYERGKKKLGGHDIYYVVTGGGGGEFTSPDRYKGGHHERDFMTVHYWKYHFIVVKVKGKKLRYVVWDKDGKVMDKFVIKHRTKK